MFNPFHFVPLLASARQSLRFPETPWRFTHRILTVLISLPRSCLLALFASLQDLVLVSSVSFSRFAAARSSGFFDPVSLTALPV